ncbi:MAG TPA: class I SAM-dependent methyltransferase [Ktedonobacteraceae bacterium]|nr:class I SAM-dependent methyltransferase [Ktedonobacteraceae bacterium]
MSTTYNDIAEWYDQYLRDNPLYREVILPNVLAMVGEVRGQEICDLACGQGWIARELAQRGARVTGIDLADNLLAMAQQHEAEQPLGVVYLHGDAQNGGPLVDQSFDGAICIMALMNITDIQAAFQTARRILKPGGWFVFAITHPCFQTPHAHWITVENGTVQRVVGDYFDEQLWTSSNPNGVRGRVGDHHRMLSTYLNTLAAANFALERMLEPLATGKRAEQEPGNQQVPSLLLVRARAL